jgi:hypothetical protein
MSSIIFIRNILIKNQTVKRENDGSLGARKEIKNPAEFLKECQFHGYA